jgi:hypothetical protein
MMYDELIAELRRHHCDAKEDDTQEVCEECAYDVIIADKSVLSGIASVCVCGLMNRAADVIEELTALLRRQEIELAELTREFVIKPRWIPVTERLPEDGVAVNIVWRNHSPVIYYQRIKDKPQTATGVCYHGRWYWWSAVVQDYLAEYGEWEPDKMDEAIEVTHWQPLPEPPKEE